MKELRIILCEDENGEKFVEVLYRGYNIVRETIWSAELVDKILEAIHEETANNIELE